MKKCLFDIPEDALDDAIKVAIDTETMGLQLDRDRLCVVQLNILYSSNKEKIYVVHFPRPEYNQSPNLKKLLKNKKIIKIFHFARFDLLAIRKYLKIQCENVRCTKIMSRMMRTFTDKHGLVDLLKDILDIQLNKKLQCSDWGQSSLTDQQYDYAANDVKYLFKLYDQLHLQAVREKKLKLFESVCDMLPTLTHVELEHFNPIVLLAFDVKSDKY